MYPRCVAIIPYAMHIANVYKASITFIAEWDITFAFHAEDIHEFTNTSDKPWYFLGIDYWIPEKLEEVAKKFNITKDSVIEYHNGDGLKHPIDPNSKSQLRVNHTLH